MTLITPAGTSAGSITSFMNSNSDAEVNSEGLITTVQPAASAGASFQPTSISGEFHGVMDAPTPPGSFKVEVERAAGSLKGWGEGVGRAGGPHGAADFVGKPAVVVEPFGQILGLRVHLRHELAVVAHFDLGQMLGMLFDQRCDAAQHLATRC